MHPVVKLLLAVAKILVPLHPSLEPLIAEVEDAEGSADRGESPQADAGAAADAPALDGAAGPQLDAIGEKAEATELEPPEQKAADEPAQQQA